MKILNNLLQIPYNSKIAIYGAGRGGEALAGFIRMQRADCDMVCFIDDAHAGGKVGGIDVVLLEEFVDIKSSAIVIVASRFFNEISDKLKKAGVREFYVANTYFFISDYEMGDYDNLSASYTESKRLSPLELGACIDKIEEAASIFSFDEDARLYDFIIKNRIEFSEDFSARLTQKSKFIYKPYFDFINKQHITRVVDAGVFDGFTTMWFLNLREDIFIHGFEPNKDAYLDGPYRQILDCYKNVNILGYGLWDSDKKLLIDNIGAASHVSDAGSLEIEVRALDGLGLEKIDYIKMDIEGAELNALMGAKNTIERFRPQLAISIYHGKTDIYEIPLYLKKTLKDYVFRLGHYSAGLDETVLYAIPKEIYC